MTASYLINQTPTLLLGGKTPYKVLFGKTPSYDNLRVFGCLAYAHNHGHRGDKFDSRSRKCVFVGYPFGKKGWTMYDMETKEFFVSRDVVFVEHEFPYMKDVICDKETRNMTGSNDVFVDDVVLKEYRAYAGEQPVREENRIDGQIEETREEPVDGVAPEVTRVAGAEPQLGRGHRQRQLSTRLKDYVIHTTQVSHPSVSPPARSLGHMQSSGSLYPIARYVNCDKFSLRHCAFLAAITAGVEPHSFAEAVKDKKWREAMQQEIHALENNGTGIVEPLPAGKLAIGCKWVYKIKYQADGTVEHYKAHLVILGNKQIEG